MQECTIIDCVLYEYRREKIIKEAKLGFQKTSTQEGILEIAIFYYKISDFDREMGVEREEFYYKGKYSILREVCEYVFDVKKDLLHLLNSAVATIKKYYTT